MFILFLALLYVVCHGQQSQLNYETDVTDFFKKTLNYQFNFQVLTGYLPIDWYFPNSTMTALFYQLVTKSGEVLQTTTIKTPVVFWFEGGPGSSSQYSSWDEHGPFYVDGDMNVKLRTIKWNDAALVVYIDQPLGVGFSFTDQNVVINSTEQAGDHLMNFLYNFYQRYPFLRINPTYFTGESYAGHYVPCFAYKLLKNINFTDINFMGISVGGPWTVGQSQTQFYDDFYYNVGIASMGTKNAINYQELRALKFYNQRNYSMVTAIDSNISNTNTSLFGYVNPYNFASYTDDDGDQSYILWFNQSTNKNNFGVPTFIQFTQSNQTIYQQFSNDFAISFQKYIEFCLVNGRVLLYNGQNDIAVTNIGVSQWINQIHWNYLQFWKHANKTVWKMNDIPVGSYKVYDNFAFALVYDSGHEVAIYQPAPAYDLLLRLLSWKWN